ncbi:hypothetical protein K469DRAFT_746140 [Zopfia rhizophila CBS 207.26]|uniref:Uncharacterized protein n=1 Tax=Zopfia rhizophila CBS 207.26 TaxID=1314779 RepID=A0A6A6EPV3_9PEZI|nr:hypothetical protein K469DRAFT_746140 [Zopfia rhizophila CBS 207.26]
MLKVEDLSVGTVAGVIAAGVFVVQFLIPTLIPLILVGLLKKENTAATWSVVGRTLHASHWPSILRTESAGVQGVRGSVRLIALLEVLLLFLISVASIVTPLGLYETVVPERDLTEETFDYAEDFTPMGNGTLPRRNDMGLSRVCWGIKPNVCPWSNTTLIESRNSTTYTADLPNGYDVRIPKNLTEIYSAGFSKLDKSVSSMFDIQWRTYKKVLKDKFMQENQPYLVGDYRHLQSIALNNAQEAIEGLIVDTKTGGIGFRNHTVPPPLPWGSTWSEDLLFIEPETECVDMNITLDFKIAMENAARDELQNVSITDHGGFANFNKEIPWFDTNKTWAHPNLRDRAYFAAWFSNVYTMFYMNITNPKNKEFSARFQYLNSTVGTQFPILESGSISSFKPSYDQLRTSQGFGEFNQVPMAMYNGSLSNSTKTSYPNPFKISTENFTDIGEACANSNNRYYANMSNIAVQCGTMYGAARRRDGSASLLFDPGTEWTIPMYSCASAFKASIKTVSFQYNGTAGLQSLKVVNITSKVYAKEEDKPLWAVENTKLRLQDANPIWGITLPEHEKHPNISTARQESLYLPGIAESLAVSPTKSIQNLAGVDFYSNVMAVAYNNMDMEGNSYYGIPDYTGRSNLAMFSKWQSLSRNPSDAAKILNLIWTDIASNAVVGTKSHLPSEALSNLAKRDEPKTTVKVPITVYTRRVRFRMLYGIPAFLVLALCAFVGVIALGFMIIGRATPSTMRRYLDQTSAGRIFTTFLYPQDCPPGAPRANWVRLVGRKRVDVGGQYPRATDSTSGVAVNPGNAAVAAAAAAATTIPYGKMDEGAISMHSLPSPQPYSPVNGGTAQGYYNTYTDAVNSSPYTYVPPGSGMLSPETGGYAEFRSGTASPGLGKPQ